MWLSLLCLLSSQCFSQINCCMDMEAKRKLVLRDAAVGRGEGSHGRGRSRDFWSWRDSCPAERGKGKNASMKCQRRTIPDSNLCSEIIRPSALPIFLRLFTYIMDSEDFHRNSLETRPLFRKYHWEIAFPVQMIHSPRPQAPNKPHTLPCLTGRCCVWLSQPRLDHQVSDQRLPPLKQGVLGSFLPVPTVTQKLHSCHMLALCPSTRHQVPWGQTWCLLKGSGYATPKYVTLERGLFWAKGNVETAETGKALWPSPFCWKQGINFPL